MNGSAVDLYNDTSYYDDLTFAATWLYRATGDTEYLTQAEYWYVAHLYGTKTTSSVSYTWLPAVAIHLVLHHVLCLHATQLPLVWFLCHLEMLLFSGCFTWTGSGLHVSAMRGYIT